MPTLLGKVPGETENDLQSPGDATEEIFEDAREEIFDSEAETSEDAMEEPSFFEEIECFEDNMEEIQVEVHRQHLNESDESEIPSVQISVGLLNEDYKTAISTINCNFEMELRKTKYEDLSIPSNTGFAGEFWVHSLLTLLSVGFSLVAPFSSRIF
jgi:hypothetical protein